MSCRSVRRWLDRGMPDGEREAVMRHVAICGACFEAFEAASGVESALRAAAAGWAAPTAATPGPASQSAATPGPAAPTPSSEFVANVMARVAVADSLARGGRLERGRSKPWVSLVTDPFSVCTITAALVVAVWTIRRPGWMLDVGMSLAGRWWSAAGLVQGPLTSRRIEVPIDLDPLLWIGLAIALFPLFAWGAWALYRRMERALLLLASKPGV